MKKYIILSYAALGILLSSCDDFLNVEPRGADQLPAEEVLNNPEGIQSVLRSAYTVLGSELMYGGRNAIIADLLADDLNGESLTQDYGAVYNHRTSVFGDYKNGHYAEPYIAIYRANLVMENLDIIQDEELKNRLLGEALFIRAISHFEVVRLYAQPYGFTEDNSHLGIPIRTESRPSAATRATVQEVYTRIISDLEEAAKLLPQRNRGYADKYAAWGFLAKVYFQMNRFEEAYSYANMVIESGEFTLAEGYGNRFSAEGTEEAVFELISDGVAANRTNGLRGNYRSNVENQQPTLTVANRFMVNLTQEDARNEWFSTELFPGLIVTTKFNFDVANNPVIHLTELKLIRAESAAELSIAGKNGNLELARQDLNDILQRAYGGNRELTENATAATIVATAREQRRLEMFGEGDRIHELKRRGAKGENITIRGASWDCPGMVLQFPQGEISSNPGFQENPEGGC